MRSGILVAVMAGCCVAALAGCKSKPVAQPDTAIVPRDSALDIDVLANDNDPDGRPLIVRKVSGGQRGSLRINADNTVRYTPREGVLGEDRFDYQVRNNAGRGSWATVTVRIVETLPDRFLATPQRPAPSRIDLITEDDFASEPARPAGDAPAGASARSTSSSSRPASSAPAAAPPPSQKPAEAMLLRGLAVTLFTREDDKNLGDTVQLILRRGKETLTELSFGDDEAWEVRSDRTIEIELPAAMAAADAGRLTLEIRKLSPTTGVGESWTMQMDVLGRMTDDTTVSLLPKTLPFRFGGGSSNNRTWQLTSPNGKPRPGGVR